MCNWRVWFIYLFSWTEMNNVPSWTVSSVFTTLDTQLINMVLMFVFTSQVEGALSTLIALPPRRSMRKHTHTHTECIETSDNNWTVLDTGY